MHKRTSELVGTWKLHGFGPSPDAMNQRAEQYVAYKKDGTYVCTPSGLSPDQIPPHPDRWSIETPETRPDLAFGFPDGSNPLLLVSIGWLPPNPEYGIKDWISEEGVAMIEKLMKTKVLVRTIAFDDEPIYYTEYRRLTPKQEAEFMSHRRISRKIN